MDGMPRIIGETSLADGRFLTLKRLTWLDDGGVEREWETADRAGGRGAVMIIAWLAPSERLALIRQYRPPARRFVIEFPAGMVDVGESPAAAALRELREETGFTARDVSVFPAAYSTPGMSDEAVFVVRAEIDESAPENRVLRPDFDPSENIETILVERSDLAEFYRRETAAENAFDAKLAAYIAALEFTGRLGHTSEQSHL